jgi:hypothetical protein
MPGTATSEKRHVIAHAATLVTCISFDSLGNGPTSASDLVPDELVASVPHRASARLPARADWRFGSFFAMLSIIIECSQLGLTSVKLGDRRLFT